MTYFEELDARLSAILWPEEEEGEVAWFERVKKELKEIVLESYRNGQKAGPKSSRKDTQPEAPEPRKKGPWPPRRGGQRQ